MSACKSPAATRSERADKKSSVKGFAFERTIGEETWLTPKWLVDALHLPEVADVDPYAPPVRHWRTARKHYDKSQDGFSRKWDESDFYWVNPPYGRECGAWMAKHAEHGPMAHSAHAEI
jgi:hypothetical protein